ncbi:MAG: AAA family ATPase [Clostridia bacterium]|nr:AAA family ATPase [Clostridia bacterium]
MELKSVSIYNFRSISSAESIFLSNYTILVGKNNEGKTNVLSAIGMAIETIDNPLAKYDINFFQRSYQRDFEYNLERDYPVKLNTG